MIQIITEYFDLPILDQIAALFHCPFLDKLMPIVTSLGDGGFLWLAIAGILLLTKKHRRAGFSMALALLAGLVVCNLTMKPLFDRMRPFDYQLFYFGRQIPLLIEAPRDPSFPSGHTIASFEAATVLMRYQKKWGIPAFIIAAIIAFSRLYLYVHYPTDVLCSVVLGICIGLLSFHLCARLKKKENHS